MALAAEPAAVDWVWVDEPLWLVWELADAFFPWVFDVALRSEALLPDWAGLFAALRLALLPELLWAALLEPLLEPAEACEDELPDELLVCDELDGDGAAALGGGGATGVEIIESRPTRGYSLRPDAL